MPALQGRYLMNRHAFRIALVFAALWLGLEGGLCGEPLALVIGQSQYRAVTPLPNPANDAKAVAQLLGEAGFEVLSARSVAERDA